jgi:N-methylhydantoinase A
MRFGVDVGGTFTDIAAVAPDGTVSVGKTPSRETTIAPAVWNIVRRLRGDANGSAPDAALIHGTTVATNALLQRSGARVVLVTTAGFEDLLWLRRQDRASLYDLARDHPAPVVRRGDVVGVSERVGPDGVVTPLTDAEVERVVGEVRRRGPDAVAIALLFSFRDPRHERRLAEALRGALPAAPVAVSHEVLPVFREYERTGTTVAEAYLRPCVCGYLERMGKEADARGIRALRVMASNGGTLSLRQARDRAAALALSGPAGGVEGARLVGAQLGCDDLLTLDMGGTSADASIVLRGHALTQPAGAIGGIPLALPQVLIETVGAGGGSVAWVDRGGALRVGPRSAGADPGPACYGLGGEEATVTDAAVVLGWLDSDHPLAAELTLDPALAEGAVGRVAAAADLSLDRCAEGIVAVANAAMVRALRRVSVERGIDPRRMTLVAFGGAGPLFVCRMAESLGMRRAVIPPHPGVLSALGLAAAPEKLEFVASVHRQAAELDRRAVDRAFAAMESEARRELPGAESVRLADCRYPGQGYEVTVPMSAGGAGAADAFHRSHRECFGFADRARSVEIVNIRLVATRPTGSPRLSIQRHREAEVKGKRRAPLEAVRPGTRVSGPFMFDGEDATCRVEPRWTGVMHETGAVVLERS